MTSQVPTKTDYRVICIGGGASGLYFAHLVPDCLLIEKMDRVGSKLLLTGGGACNFTHEGEPEEIAQHYYEKRPFVTPALYAHSPAAIREHFRQLGVESVVRENGCVFPSSGKAETIVQALESRCGNILTGCTVKNIVKREDEGFTVQTDKGDFTCQKVVLATGGISYPETGSTGDGYSMAKKLRCRTIDPRPGLTRVHFFQPFATHIEGITAKNVKIWQDDKVYEGDIMMTNNGFSGPAILNLSRDTAKRSRITIQFYPIEKKDFASMKNKLALNAICEFTGLADRLVKFLLVEIADFIDVKRIADLNAKEISYIVQQLSRYPASVSTRGEIKTAMVTHGGVETNCVSRKTYECTTTPGFYIIGEVLNVDGECGGYNLTFAFASAFSAAEAVNNS